ncbi:hypothetical protein FHG87_002502 [Trinorchestia longiramus]|nr:hypothetical protein FHG87_002502 [Trinorchestia longiramus]
MPGMASVNGEILPKQDLENPDNVEIFLSPSESELDTKIYEPANKAGKEKQVVCKSIDDDKPKQKTKRSLIPFYSTFVFGNRGSKSPGKDKRKKMKGDSKLLLSDDNDDEQEKKDEEKGESIDAQNGQTLEESELDGTSSSEASMCIDNKLYGESHPNRDEVDAHLSDGATKKSLTSPKLSGKNDLKKYSLVKSRIAKYQKNTASQKDKGITSYEVCHGSKSKTLEHPSRASVVRSKFSTLDGFSRYPNQVSNLSYESVDFPGSFAVDLKDVECDRQALYDELKLIYNDGEIYAVKGSKADPLHQIEDETGILRPHLSIDSITLISNKNMKASLNISVSGNPERVSAALPDTRWREAGKFSRRSIRKSTSKKKSDAKKIKSSSGTSTASTSPQNEESTLDDRLVGSEALAGYRDYHWSHMSQDVLPSFPEYAKVNKKKNGHLEAQPSLDSLSLDYRKIAFRGCGEKGPVAKKIGQCAWKHRKESEKKHAVPVKKTDSFKASKVVRKGSFTHAVRPKVVKKVAQNFQDLHAENASKPSGVKLRRRDSRSVGKEGYRLSVTVQPRTVASLTNKFNSLISQNLEAGHSSVVQTQIPLGHVAIKDGKLGRVYRSPRASFKRKYRTKNHKNKRTARVHSPEVAQGDKRDLNEPQTTSVSSQSPEQDADPSSSGTHSQKPRRPVVNIQKVPSIGRGPGDNKTDEEKVCDKIETALSSGKFKGETDESDAEHEDDESKKSEKITAHQNSNEISDENSLASTSQNAAESSVFVTEADNTTEKELKLTNEASSDHNNVSCDVPIDDESPQSESQQSDGTHDTSSSEASLVRTSSGKSMCHQKSESIDSGIAADEAVSSVVVQTIPAILEERRIVGIFGSIDQPADGNNDIDSCDVKSEALRTFEESKYSTEKSSGEFVHCLDSSNALQEEDETDPRNTEESVTPFVSATEDDSTMVTVVSKSKKEPSASELSSEHESAERLEKEKIDALERISGAEECASDGESKIYSSIFKAVVKNTVRKTKEKDSLKKENDREVKVTEKESWFKRSRSKERIENNKGEEKTKGAQLSQECVKGGVSNPVQNIQKDETETGAKPKKEKDGKIYESWIFKKIREKSQERKKFKDFTPVNINIGSESNTEDVSEALDASMTKDSKSKQILKDPGVQKTEQSLINDNSDLKKIANESPEKKDENYGLFSFRSRGRTKEKKKTKNSSDKSSMLQDAAKEASGVLNEKESSTEGSMTASPTSSLRTLHSRKLSDTSVCTVESESLCSKASSTKLKASNSQRSTSSIPPPPKTPIPSPPKSARIVLRLKDEKNDEDNDDRDEAVGKGSSENIYENLYSVDLDKLKKNRAKLEERGIVPNSSFLWNDGNPVNVPVYEVSSRNQILERQHPVSKITGIKSFGQPHRTRRDLSLPRMDLPGDDGPNYSELQHLGGTSDDSHATAAYDEIGGMSSMSYDDIRMFSSCSYDDIRAPSSVGYDSIKAPSSSGGYDLVNPPPARSDSNQYDECDGGVVTAQLAVVREDQLDSISYLYDDITYNASQTSHSYEPVNPPGVNAGVPGSMPAPLVISSIQEVPEPEGSPTIESNMVEGSDEEEGDGDAHEVFSYSLTHVGDSSAAAEPSRVADSGSALDNLTVQDTSMWAGGLDTSTRAPDSIDATSATTPEMSELQPPSPLEETPTVLLGLRDSLRSSVSSYHSAYSARYFTRAQVDATRAQEEESGPQTSEKKKKSPPTKVSDEARICRFRNMGRKIRELSKLGKLKNSEKEAVKKIRDKHLENSCTFSGINEDDLPLEGTDVSAMEPLDIEVNEAIYGTNAVSNDLYSAAWGIELSSLTTSTNTSVATSKKSKKPKLTLSDCTPLPEGFHSYVYHSSQHLDDTYGSSDEANDNAENFYGSIYAPKSMHGQAQDITSELDEWEDLSDDLSDEELPPLSLGRVQRMVRAPVRTNRWGQPQPRAWRKTWSQGVRDVTGDSLVNNRSYSQCSNNQLYALDDTMHSPSHCLHSPVDNIRCKAQLGLHSQAAAIPLGTKSSSAKGRSRNGKVRKNSTRRRTLFLQDALYGPFDLENERYVSEHVVRSRMRPSRKQKYRLEGRHQTDRELGRYRRRGREYPIQ